MCKSTKVNYFSPLIMPGGSSGESDELPEGIAIKLIIGLRLVLLFS